MVTVRIGRRGGAGAVLNSKSEYNRCYIPRLRLEEDEEQTKNREEQQKLEDKEREQRMQRDQGAWELGKTKLRDGERREQAKVWGARLPPTRSKKCKDGADGTTPGRRKKARKHELLREDWGLERSNTMEQSEVDNNQPQIPPSPAPPTLSSLSQTVAPPTAPPESPIPPEAPPETFPGGKPDDNSLQLERAAQGLPPVQVAPSVEHLYVGHLGEVTKGWGSDLTSPPPNIPPSPPIFPQPWSGGGGGRGQQLGQQSTSIGARGTTN